MSFRIIPKTCPSSPMIARISIPMLFSLLIITAMPLIIVSYSYAQTGSMSNLPNIRAIYAVSIIPGAAQKQSLYHYYPPAINVPVGTTVAWFNNDFGQPHTVTSGLPNASDAGSVFNSGLMPATANSFYQYTFNKPGDYVYHCKIHPWRTAIVTVSDSFERGHYFQMSSGVGPVLNLSKDFRTLFDFKPLTVSLDKTTPLTYNITLIKNGEKVYSKTFVTSGESLPVEIIKNSGSGSTTGNQTTITYGPDFSGTGAYHVQGLFLDDNANYTIRVELTAINSKHPQNPIVDEFTFRTVTE